MHYDPIRQQHQQKISPTSDRKSSKSEEEEEAARWVKTKSSGVVRHMRKRRTFIHCWLISFKRPEHRQAEERLRGHQAEQAEALRVENCTQKTKDERDDEKKDQCRKVKLCISHNYQVCSFRCFFDLLQLLLWGENKEKTKTAQPRETFFFVLPKHSFAKSNQATTRGRL